MRCEDRPRFQEGLNFLTRKTLTALVVLLGTTLVLMITGVIDIRCDTDESRLEDSIEELGENIRDTADDLGGG